MSFTKRSLFKSALALSGGALIASGMNRPLSAQTNRAYIDGLGFPGGRSLEEGAALLPAELEDIAQSSLQATHLTVGSVGDMAPLEAFEKIVRDIVRMEAEISRNPEVLAQIRTGGDLSLAAESGVTGLIYGLQDGVSFEDDLGRLEALHHLGVRIIQPTYNRRNLLGDGCMEAANAGLSKTGHAAVEKMDTLKILLDLSHCGRQTAADAVSTSTRAFSFTHTGCDALVSHPRHRTDAELRAAANSGGVSGIFIMPYLAMGKQPTAADVVRHLEHAINVAGEDHVGIGTDGSISPVAVTEAFRESFRKITRMRRESGIAAPHETEDGYLFASDLNSADRFSRISDLLATRGHSQDRIAKVLGGNFLRLFKESWS